MNCIVEPFGARVVVKIDGFKYTGKLIIPDTAKQTPTTGVIVAIGPDVNSTLPGENAVAIGNHIVFSTFAGVAIVVNKEYYRVLGAEEILGRIPAEAQLDEQVP